MENGWGWVGVLAEEERAGASRLLPDRITVVRDTQRRMVACSYLCTLTTTNEMTKRASGGGGMLKVLRAGQKKLGERD
jgi:hypothetical protein